VRDRSHGAVKSRLIHTAFKSICVLDGNGYKADVCNLLMVFTKLFLCSSIAARLLAEIRRLESVEDRKNGSILLLFEKGA